MIKFSVYLNRRVFVMLQMYIQHWIREMGFPHSDLTVFVKYIPLLHCIVRIGSQLQCDIRMQAFDIYYCGHFYDFREFCKFHEN